MRAETTSNALLFIWKWVVFPALVTLLAQGIRDWLLMGAPGMAVSILAGSLCVCVLGWGDQVEGEGESSRWEPRTEQLYGPQSSAGAALTEHPLFDLLAY